MKTVHHSQNPGKNKNILIVIVEDDIINARIFRNILFRRLANLYKPGETVPSGVRERICMQYENIAKPELILDIIHTEDVEEILHLAQAGEADLVLMDVSLAHSFYRGKSVDGIKITQMLKSDTNTASIPVILVTAHAMEGDRENFLKQSGADHYISKPIVDQQQFAGQIDYFLKSSNKITNYLNRDDYPYQEINKQMPDKNHQNNNRIEKNQNDDVYKEYKIICGSVAHSLKGEFMNMGSSIQEIRELANDSSDIQEECDLMYRSLEYSQIVLRQLLDYLNIGKPSIEPIDVSELIKKTELLARPRLPSNIELNIAFDSNIQSQVVLGNFEQLMSILLELIKNATKALPQQGGKIEISIEKKERDIAISVKDNGTGISEEIKEKLLKETVHSKSGMGVGLFVSNKVISELGGKLNLHSSPEEGTKATIILPTPNE